MFVGVSQTWKPSITKGDSLGTSQVYGTPEFGKRRSSGSAYGGSNPPGVANQLRTPITNFIRLHSAISDATRNR